MIREARSLPLLAFLILNCHLMLLPVDPSGVDSSCPNLKSVPCGNVNVSYPFWLSNEPNQIPPYCGYQSFMLTCQSGGIIPILRLGDYNFTVLDIDYNYTVLVDAPASTCRTVHQNVTLPSNISLSLADTKTELSLFFNCSSLTSSPSPVIPCLQFDESTWDFQYNYEYDSPTDCHNQIDSSVLEPYVGTELAEEYAQIMNEGLKLHRMGDTNGNCSYCKSSDGRCRNDTNDVATLIPTCFCSGGKIEVVPRLNFASKVAVKGGIDASSDVTLSSQLSRSPSFAPLPAQPARRSPAPGRSPGSIAGAGRSPAPGRSPALGSSSATGRSPAPAPGWSLSGARRKKHTTLIIGIVIGATVGVILACFIPSYFLCFREPNGNEDQAIQNFILQYESTIPKRYTYAEIKRMTKSFSDKLGSGGYGSVFKGSLQDGRLVAVKILSETKGNGEDFINEVASISRTSHVNIVALLGFCLKGSKRALVYEFMPNGSLDKFIFDSNSNMENSQLNTEKLYDIAVSIARGLEYLHRGCNTRIVHFDIKPHNILLDQDFCPKISDFGLAKICMQKDSIISTMAMRGTPGYIAPELFSRTFGTISSKSDVYSYGMMVLEMIGGRKNFNSRADHSSESYFPHWVYDNLDDFCNLTASASTSEVSCKTKEIERKMIIVGLWCIQIKPENRPSISMVVDMLEGSINALQMPPKPEFS